MAEPEIVIIKKVSGHGGHHGGAWKVAYADFVTGMMALFIVLWLMNSTPQVQKAVGGYFRDPKGSSTEAGTDKNGPPMPVEMKKEDLNKLKEQIVQSMQKSDLLKKLKDQIAMTVTDEGLRIDLMESAKGTFFELGSPAPTPVLRELLQVLGQELGKLPNKISVEGHTDASPFAGKKAYDNWDLSTDRANAARRIMQEEGVGPEQISQVRGFADQRLRLPDKPQDPSNRRITLIVQYQGAAGEVALPGDLSKLAATTPPPSAEPAAPAAAPAIAAAKPEHAATE